MVSPSPFTLSADETLAQYQAHASGLLEEEAVARQALHGRNVLPKQPLPSLFTLFFRQFLSPLIYVLLAAAVVALFLKEYSDTIFIGVVLLINAVIGAAQEYSAQQAALALEKMVPLFAHVLREGKALSVPSEMLVPGDIVLLASGDKVPADMRLLTCDTFMVDESQLTGESTEVHKDAASLCEADTPVADRFNMVFAGSIVTRGRGRGVVVATGVHTQLGTIASTIAGKDTTKLPLLVRMEALTMRMTIAILGIIVLLFTVALLEGEPLGQVLLLGVALAVSAIPEGLPAAITITLAIGMRRMASAQVIVRKLMAVEGLGSCTFIASDKTGTLTVNQLTAKRIALPSGVSLEVTGEGVSLQGEIRPLALQKTLPQKEAIQELLLCSLLTNEAYVNADATVCEGDMVDIAFQILARKAGISREHALETHPEIGMIPYESHHGFSASAHRYEGETYIAVKGSYERLLPMCTHMQGEDAVLPLDASPIIAQAEGLAKAGYRVLALAAGGGEVTGTLNKGHLQGLAFLGLVGMIDPLRPEAKEAVEQCKRASIRVAIITGDHPLTAKAIGMELGLVEDGARIVTGVQLKAAQASGMEAVDALVQDTSIFARVEPTQKKDIVDALIRQGHFVAVTGDGVNDAPALRHAHVGIAMGKRGTDVARESAELILADDNFASIVKGIEEGRVIYANIRKVIGLLISTGVAEIVLFFLSVLFNMPMPLTPVQVLWLNLVTEGIQHIALALEPKEGDELNKPPRPPKEPIFNRLMVQRVALGALVMGTLAFATFAWMLQSGYDMEAARNSILLLMVLFENVHVFNNRSEAQSIFRQPVSLLAFGAVGLAQGVHILALYLPGLSDVLETQPVTWMEWAALLGLATLLVVVCEMDKLWWKWMKGKRPLSL